MHSPWGFLYQLVKETGWTWHELLWEMSHVNLVMMMADRPQVTYKKKKKKLATDGELKNILGL